MTSKKRDKCRSIGEIGEDIVAEYFKFAKKTDDWYDSNKDGTIAKNITYEVKTLRLNHKSQGFWIAENQWNKCDNVDVLFFLKVPEKVEDGISFYIMTNHKTQYKNITYKGKKIRIYPLTKCLPIDIIRDSRCEQILNTSIAISTYKRVL